MAASSAQTSFVPVVAAIGFNFLQGFCRRTGGLLRTLSTSEAEGGKSEETQKSMLFIADGETLCRRAQLRGYFEEPDSRVELSTVGTDVPDPDTACVDDESNLSGLIPENSTQFAQLLLVEPEDRATVQFSVLVGLRHFFPLAVFMPAFEEFVGALAVSDAAVQTAIGRDFPEVWAILGTIVVLDRLRVMDDENQQDQTYKVDVDAPINSEALAVKYPKVAALIKTWLGDVQIDFMSQDFTKTALSVGFNARKQAGLVRLDKRGKGLLWQQAAVPTLDDVEVHVDEDEARFGPGHPVGLRVQLSANMMGYHALAFKLPTLELLLDTRGDGQVSLKLLRLQGRGMGLARWMIGGVLDAVLDTLHFVFHLVPRCSEPAAASSEETKAQASTPQPAESGLGIGIWVAGPRTSVMAWFAQKVWDHFVRRAVLFELWGLFADLLAALGRDVAALTP